MAGWLVERARVAITAMRLWCARRIWDKPAIVAGTTHVIIDMQERFLQDILDRDRTVAAAIENIEEAKRQGDAIVLLQYRSNKNPAGPVDPKVLAHLDGYTRCFTYDKWIDNGAPEVEQALLEHDLANQVFRLYGLNADACVLRTGLGLRTRFPRSRVEVIKDACSSYNKHVMWPAYHWHQRRQIWLGYYVWPGAWRIRLVRNRGRQA